MSVQSDQSHDLRPPLSKAKGDGSAHDGVYHWIAQRLSAIALLPLGVLFLIWLKYYGGASYSDIVQSLDNPWVSGFMFLFITAASYHGALGIQVVIEDYVTDLRWRQWLLIKTKLVMFLLPVMSLFFLIKIMLG